MRHPSFTGIAFRIVLIEIAGNYELSYPQNGMSFSAHMAWLKRPCWEGEQEDTICKIKKNTKMIIFSSIKSTVQNTESEKPKLSKTKTREIYFLQFLFLTSVNGHQHF